jgi:hypothetical protein
VSAEALNELLRALSPNALEGSSASTQDDFYEVVLRIEAETKDDAIDQAETSFREAVKEARLPKWPVEVIGAFPE